MRRELKSCSFPASRPPSKISEDAGTDRGIRNYRELQVRFVRGKIALYLALIAGPAMSVQAATYQVYVTNERSGDVTVIDSGDFSVVATIPVGKRPRGIHVGPNGKTIYVALSGTPIEAPPQIDAQGNPVFEKKTGKDDEDAKPDKAADGIGGSAETRRHEGTKSSRRDPIDFFLRAFFVPSRLRVSAHSQSPLKLQHAYFAKILPLDESHRCQRIARPVRRSRSIDKPSCPVVVGGAEVGCTRQRGSLRREPAA